ncbi:MAG: hypothetical protein ACH350_10125 [Parachlamydiaceae bacterium]
MNSLFEQINIGISLADAQLESYFYDKNQNTLIIRIKSWNAKLIEFVFSDLIGFTDRGGNFIMDFCKKISGNDLCKVIIEKSFEGNPKSNHYNFFQFLDIGNEPYLEIICKKFDWKLL